MLGDLRLSTVYRIRLLVECLFLMPIQNSVLITDLKKMWCITQNSKNVILLMSTLTVLQCAAKLVILFFHFCHFNV